MKPLKIITPHMRACSTMSDLDIQRYWEAQGYKVHFSLSYDSRKERSKFRRMAEQSNPRKENR